MKTFPDRTSECATDRCHECPDNGERLPSATTGVLMTRPCQCPHHQQGPAGDSGASDQTPAKLPGLHALRPATGPRHPDKQQEPAGNGGATSGTRGKGEITPPSGRPPPDPGPCWFCSAFGRVTWVGDESGGWVGCAPAENGHADHVNVDSESVCRRCPACELVEELARMMRHAKSAYCGILDVRLVNQQYDSRDRADAIADLGRRGLLP